MNLNLWHAATISLACAVFVLGITFTEGSDRAIVIVGAGIATALFCLRLIVKKYPRIEINHIPFFTFGFFFYWVLPLLIRPEGPYLFPVSDKTVAATLWIMAGIYACFIIGDRIGARLRYEPRPSVPLSGCRALLYILSLATLAYIVIDRDNLFVEYADNPVRGTLTTFVLFLFAVAISRAASRNEASVGNRYFAAFFAFCLLLAYLGQRMSLVSACIMLAVYRSCYFGKVSTKKLAVGFAAAVFLVALLGLARMGDEVTLVGIGANLLGEPIGTSISLLDFLSNHHAPLLAAPFPLLSRFSNLLPSAIAGNKLDMVTAWRGDISSPFGSFNAYVSWMLNFGIVGSFVFAILVGFFFRWLRQKDTALSRAIYPMLCGWLAFSFFRDDFGIVIVKEMVEASIIFPLIVFGLSRLISRATPEILPRGIRLFPNVFSRQSNDYV